MSDEFWKQNFNTSLSPEEEQQFVAWLDKQSQTKGRDVSLDLVDYDLRGYWKRFGGKENLGHGPDTFKKPNHPSFSVESIYHGTPDPWGGTWQGGNWIGNDEDGWTFWVAPSMLKKTHTRDQLQQYFAENEPGVGLAMPTINVR